jgi:hypothetical protein
MAEHALASPHTYTRRECSEVRCEYPVSVLAEMTEALAANANLVRRYYDRHFALVSIMQGAKKTRQQGV